MFDELTRRKKHGDRTEHWVRETSRQSQMMQQQQAQLNFIKSPFYAMPQSIQTATWVSSTASGNTLGLGPIGGR